MVALYILGRLFDMQLSNRVACELACGFLTLIKQNPSATDIWYLQNSGGETGAFLSSDEYDPDHEAKGIEYPCGEVGMRISFNIANYRKIIEREIAVERNVLGVD